MSAQSEYQRAWYQENKRSVIAHVRQYRKASAKKIQAYEVRRRKERPEIGRAHHFVSDGLAHGRIVKPNKCNKCGKFRKLEAHHPDYSQPEVFVWLCKPCHGVEDTVCREKGQP